MLGLLVLEGILRANTSLLLRGMEVPAPVDTPLTVYEYDVFASDGDLFYWHPGLIRSIPDDENKIEAHVRFETDEFGFPNATPLPAKVDVVVLGRSFSFGAQVHEPWPVQLSSANNLQVLNLSEPRSGIYTKVSYLERFGWLRKPKWVVLQVLPSWDILGFTSLPTSVIQQLPFPLIRSFWKQSGMNIEGQSNPIYPIKVDVSERSESLVFFSYYLSALTVGQAKIEASQQWAAYATQVLSLQTEAQTHSACVVLLYVPTKEEIYFPLATHPAQLEPILPLVIPWLLDEKDQAIESVSIPEMQANAHSARDVIRDFAVQNHFPFVDPTAKLEEAAMNGASPYLRYDTHWSDVGHSIIAKLVAETLQQTPCP